MIRLKRKYNCNNNQINKKDYYLVELLNNKEERMIYNIIKIVNKRK
jgi:hypothetical protein